MKIVDRSVYVRHRLYVHCQTEIRKAAKALGHTVHIETQGTIGTEDANCTMEEIKAADVVIIAADIKIGGKDRFEGKRW